MTITPEERARAITLLNQFDWCVYRDDIPLGIEEVVRFERLARAAAMRKSAREAKEHHAYCDCPNGGHCKVSKIIRARAAELEESCRDD